MKALACVGLLGCGAAIALAHDLITTKLTYTRDIAPIFAHRCLACHNAESSVVLTNYQQIRPWAVSIKEQVLSRAMPPWGAVKGFGDLKPDHALTQEEMLIVASWVIGGAPEGKASAISSRQPKAPRESVPAMSDALSISTAATLAHPLTIVGLRPIPEQPVRSAQILAYLPDGEIKPLVWLYNFDPKLHDAFHFATPIALPAGTRVRSSETLRFALQAAAPPPAQPVN